MLIKGAMLIKMLSIAADRARKRTGTFQITAKDRLGCTCRTVRGQINAIERQSCPRWYGSGNPKSAAATRIPPTAAAEHQDENNDDHDCSHNVVYPRPKLIKRDSRDGVSRIVRYLRRDLRYRGMITSRPSARDASRPCERRRHTIRPVSANWISAPPTMVCTR
jgi:hypothetical protein